jgi:hypothetical protein
LREDPREFREPPSRAVHASRPAPLTWRLALRVLAIASGVCLFLSLLGPFTGGVAAVAERVAPTFIYGWIGSLLGLASARLVWRLGLWPRSFWLAGLPPGLLMAGPMCAVVWLGNGLTNGHLLSLYALPTVLWDTALICIGASYLAVLISRRTQPMTGASSQPAKFLERLPLKLRGAEIWAVEAEDHYLRLHTSKGQDLILMRLSDAIEELRGIEGARAHRSWWVARDAITEAVRGDGRATLTLQDGAQVPVSRTYARLLRERGWF